MTTDDATIGYGYRERRDTAAAGALGAIGDALKLLADGYYGQAQGKLRAAVMHLERAAGEDECLTLAQRANAR